MIKIGSLFSGIGGFELGLERAIPKSETIWQVEQNTFCQKVLSKHWPNAKIYNDVRNITRDNVKPIDILCGGFPCQDISLAGKLRGLHGEKSGLWWEMLRIIGELAPKIIVLENVAAITIRGGCEVIGSLTEIGYCTEWTVISAKDFGAPHLRRRWFAVAYTDSASCKRSRISIGVQQKDSDFDLSFSKERYWRQTSPVSALCGVDDGVPDRLDRLRALGNAIVPQCSEWVGQQIVKSGLLQDML